MKNVFLKNERTLTRKILEMLLASLIETRMSKQDILHAYLCKVCFKILQSHLIYACSLTIVYLFPFSFSPIMIV